MSRGRIAAQSHADEWGFHDFAGMIFFMAGKSSERSPCLLVLVTVLMRSSPRERLVFSSLYSPCLSLISALHSSTNNA